MAASKAASAAVSVASIISAPASATSAPTSVPVRTLAAACSECRRPESVLPTHPGGVDVADAPTDEVGFQADDDFVNELWDSDEEH